MRFFRRRLLVESKAEIELWIGDGFAEEIIPLEADGIGAATFDLTDGRRVCVEISIIGNGKKP